MNHTAYTFLIALTNNFDNIGVRIAYSMRGVKISALINLWIAVITFVISFLAASSGTIVSGFLSKQASSLIAMVLLTSIGVYMIGEQYMKKTEDKAPCIPVREPEKELCRVLLNPEHADMDGSKHIDFREATILGIALSINNVGGGLSAGMIGLDSFLVGLLSALISFIALWAGNYVSDFFIRGNMHKKATVIAGLLLIAIGIEQIM